MNARRFIQSPRRRAVILAGHQTWFVQYGEGDRLAGTALLEMYDGDDRLVLDHVASCCTKFASAGRQ
jgi:hypothetical protein